MNSKFENGLFIFRRDLRVVDNNGLNLLNDKCKNVYTIFIFTPEQVGDGNKYKSDNSVQFMITSLQDLNLQVCKKGGKLYTFYGDNDKVVADCIKAFNIDVVCFNLDITPYARERDNKIIKLCEVMETYVMYDYDYYLCEPGSIVTGGGTPYLKFTPYYDTAKKIKVEKPKGPRKLHFKKSEAHIPNKITLDFAMKKFVGKENANILVHGGRTEALKQMRLAAKNIKHYPETHNELSKPTSQLSAYIKFGCISIREVYKVFRSKSDFIRQLFWRDFYAQVLYSFPQVLGHSLKPKYDKIKWRHNEKWFAAWCKGMTGFPAVDAQLDSPYAVAVDRNGVLYIADHQNNVIRMVDLTGNIYTIAGTGALGYTGDGGLAVTATFNYPTGIAVDTFGNIYISDSYNNAIRMIDTAKNINLFAGNTYPGFGGDLGGPLGANLYHPYGVDVDAYGSVFIADVNNQRIRKVYITTVGINDVNSSREVEAYPNPFVHEIVVSGLVMSDKVCVYDLAGRAVGETWTASNDGEETFKINDLAPGMYLLRVSDAAGNTKATIKMTK